MLCKMFSDGVQSSRLRIMHVVISFFIFVCLIEQVTPIFKEYNIDCTGDDSYEDTCPNVELHKLKKQCIIGQWSQSLTSCYEVSMETAMNEDYCFYITEPTTYTRGCPNYESRACHNITPEYIWSGKDDSFCAVRSITSLKAVSCKDLHPHLCMYKKGKGLDHQKKPLFELEITLSFNERKKQMQLTVYTPEGVVRSEDDIKCFTYRYNLEEEPYKMIDVEEKFDSRKANRDKDQLDYRNFTVFLLDIKDKPNEYWCKVFIESSGKIITSDKRVGFTDDVGNEFVMYLEVTVPEKFPKDHLKLVTKFCGLIKTTCRVFKLLNFDKYKYKSSFLMHITTKYRKSISEEYTEIKNIFQSQDYLNVVNMTTSDWCLPKNDNISWSLTPIGGVSVPSELCITKYGVIATRKCEGDFLYGAKWEKFEEECLEEPDIPATTKFLHAASTIHEITVDTVKNTSLLLNYSQNLSVTDVSLISNILFQTSLSSNVFQVAGYFYDIYDRIFELNSRTLEYSQDLLNSTDVMVNALDLYLTRYSEDKLNDSENFLSVHIKSNLIVHITKPFSNNISGFALYGNSNSFLNCTVTHLYTNTSMKSIELNSLQAASYVPETLLDRLLYDATEEERLNLTIITTIFINDSIFNEDVEHKNRSVGSKIISVIIPGYETYLEHPLPILLKQHTYSTKDTCGYWEYGKNSQGRKGKWSSTGINYKQKLENSSVLNCGFSHLTHFALLIMGERHNQVGTLPITKEYNFELTVVSIFCSVVSVVGILGIFLTAIIYKQWREKPGTKFLLQLSILIICEMIFIQLASLKEYYQHTWICTLFGILLHYVVLSKLAWMLVIAFLQYLRFVRVLGAMPTRLLLKSMLVGWLAPLIPVLLTVIIVPENYSFGHNFCYPKGLALYIGLITPSTLIMAANISVFVLVMAAIRASKAAKYDKSGKMVYKQICLAILLFFLLGIHWTFGIIAEILPSSWITTMFMFLFCTTTGLQGFVLFTFYVVLDKETRLLWIKSIKSRF